MREKEIFSFCDIRLYRCLEEAKLERACKLHLNLSSEDPIRQDPYNSN